MSAGPVCRWCYVVSRYRRNGRLGSLRLALECARSVEHHPLQATLRNTGPRVGLTHSGGSSAKVSVRLEAKARPDDSGLPPLPRAVVDDLIIAAEMILAESGR